MDETESEVLAHIDAALEKNAGLLRQIGAGFRGLRQGASQVAHDQKARAAVQNAVNTLHKQDALPLNIVNGVLQPLPMGAGVGYKNPGFFARAKEQLSGALAGAKQEFGQTRRVDQAMAHAKAQQQTQHQIQQAQNVLQRQGQPAPAQPHAPTPAYASQPAPVQQGASAVPAPPQAPQYAQPQTHVQAQAHTPAPAPAQSGAYAVNPAPQPNWLSRNATPLTMGVGAAALGTTLVRGGPVAAEQDARMRDYMYNSQQNMGAPVPAMSVYASYDEFAEEKLAAFSPVYPTVQGAVANSLANQLATKFVGDPIDAVQKVLKKKLYDEPKHRTSFQLALEGDDMLQAEHRENPQGLADTFHTLKTFAPSIAKNPQATRTFLRQATMSKMHGTGPDFATIRLMAETEKFIQNAKGRGTP